MYFVKYGEEYLHDPRVGVTLPTATLDTELNSSDFLKFTIAPNNELYSVLVEHDQDNLVTVFSDDVCIFRGEITSISKDFQNVKTVECRGEMAYLNDSLVRPYSTIEGEASNTAPSSVDGYFAYLIEEHNSQVSANKRFMIDINAGNELDPNNYIYRSDTNYPSVGSTIKDKILESIGGYLVMNYQNETPSVSLLSDFAKTNAQLIDFGVNLLDFIKEENAANVATFVIPVGKAPEQETAEDDEVQPLSEKLTITNEPNGSVDKDYIKSGDIIYSSKAVERYGWIGALVEYSDVTVASHLVTKGLIALKALESPDTTIEIKAIDLSMIKPNYEPITIGQYVRARSNPHSFDSYLLCTKVSYDLNRPDNNTFTLGTTFDTLTGQQNKRINALNATINTVYESADKISAEAKAAAEIATNAQETAEEAEETATLAQSTATAAQSTATAAQSTATAAQSTATAAQNTATAASTAINNLSIGSRNLLLKTEFTEASDYTTYANSHTRLTRTTDGLKYTADGQNRSGFEFVLSQAGILENNKEYTLSFKYRTNSSNVFRIYVLQETSPNVEIENVEPTTVSETDWQEYKCTFSQDNINVRTSVKLLFPYLMDGWFEIKDKSLMLEKGNKATDWKPAPEDTGTMISEVSGEVENVRTTATNAATTAAAAQTTANNASAAASTAQSAAENAQDTATAAQTAVTNLSTTVSQNSAAIVLRATKTEAQGYATTAKNEAISAASSDATTKANNAISTAAADATSKVNAIQVGGRNLLLYTDTTKDILNKWRVWGAGVNSIENNWLKCSYNTSSQSLNYGARTSDSFDFVANQLYTLSFDVYATQTMDINYCYVMSSGGNLSLTSIIDCEATTIPKRYSITFSKNSDRTNCSILIGTSDSTALVSGAAFYIRNVKLEIGNKATDWTEAPEDTAEAIVTTQTQITQTADEVRMDFNSSIASVSTELQQQIQSGESGANARFSEINRYIRFVDGKIVLGETGNELQLTVQNDRVSFTQSGVEVAYFSNNKLYIKQAEVLTSLRVGNYEFVPRNDGSLALKKHV